MSLSWYWWFSPKSASLPTQSRPKLRKRDKLRRLFTINKTSRICECENIAPEATPSRPADTEIISQTEKAVADSAAVLSEPEPITIEEVTIPKGKVNESPTLLRRLRLTWMKSQAARSVQNDETTVQDEESHGAKVPKSLYFLQDIGHGTSTTEVSNITGMQA